MTERMNFLQPARVACAGWLFLWFASDAHGEGPSLKFLESEGVVEAANLPVSEFVPAEILQVHVISGNDAATVDVPAVAGTYASTQGTLRFTPRFGFEPGIRYQARLHVGGAEIPLIQFGIERPKRETSTTVTAIYPSIDAIPENHLRFYVHFSAPMSRGFATRHLALMNEDGTKVDLPFLELDEELWDPEGKRLTLFFDPGRVKRGLKPREESGPVLVAGKTYTLVVSEEFQDANALPLKGEFRRTFRATPVDYTQPDPAKWRLSLPRPGTSAKLQVTFEAPLDHGMLQRMIEIYRAGGARIDGEIEIGKNERVWSFTPEEPWKIGRYVLRIDRLLEDSCGNSIERHFEVARAERTVPVPKEQFTEIAFEIGRPDESASNRHWGEWRGPHRSGISSERDLPVSWSPGELLVWKTKTAGPGASTPIVWGNRVFITAQTGRDAKIQRPGVVLSHADDELQLCVQCFRRTDGELLWEKRIEPSGTLTPTHTLHNQCTPSCVTDGECVIAWFATGQLFCFDMDGNEQWSRNLAEAYGDFDLLWAHASSPTLYEDLVYVLCDHNPQANLVALNKSTGEEVWKAGRGSGLRSYSTPLIHEQPGSAPQIIVNSNPGIDGYDARSGRHLWTFEEFCKVPVPVPVAVSGTLFTSRGYTSGPFMALPIPVPDSAAPSAKRTKKDAIWRMPSRAPYVSSPLAYHGRIYLASENGQVICLDQKSGEIHWSRKLGTTFWASPVAGDGKVYLLDEAGEMIVLSDGPELTVLARNTVPISKGERMLGSPSISHGCLFYRSESSLFCVGTRKGRKSESHVPPNQNGSELRRN